MSKLSSLLVRFSHWLLPVASTLIIFCLVTEPALAGALDPDNWSAITGPIAMLVSGLILLIVLFALMFALALGYLMDSTYILDTGMGDTLYLVWEVMRNFVNLGFILILLIIAVMVIFGGGGERGLGMLKKITPKFILALVLVNFTFFGARFILTTNDVLATAIFSLPRVVSSDKTIRMPCTYDKKNPTTNEFMSCFEQIEETFKETLKGDEGKSSKEFMGVTKKLTDPKRFFPHTVESLAVGQKNVSLILLTNMIDLEHIAYSKGLLGDGWEMAIGAIGSLIVAAVVGIIFLMLFLAFAVRMVVLWIAIAVSPIAALGIVLKDLIPGFDMGQGGFDPMKLFINHAFMPAMVAVPLSIGMVMLFANNTLGMDPSNGWIQTFSEGGGNIHALLWWVASIIVVWFGTNKMISQASPDFAQKLTDGVHGGVNKFAKGTADLVKYAPIMPAWSAPMSAINRVVTTGQNRHAAVGEGMLKNSGLDPAWYSAPTTKSQVESRVHSAADSKDRDGLYQQLKDLMVHLRQSSNGKDMLDTKVRTDAIQKMGKTLHTSQLKSGMTLGEIIEQISGKDSNNNLNHHERDHIRRLRDMVITGAEEELEEIATGHSKDAISQAVGKAASSKTGKSLDISKEGTPVEAGDMKISINGGTPEQVYKTKSGIYCVMNTEGKPEDGFKMLGEKSTVESAISLLDDKMSDKKENGKYMAGQLKEISDMGGLVDDTQKDTMRKVIEKALDKTRIEAEHANNILPYVKKIFGSAGKDLEDRLSKLAKKA